MSARSSHHKIDKPFLLIVMGLVGLGFIIFMSASLGLAARDNIQLSTIVLNQLGLGLGLGSVAAFIISKIDYHFWRKHSFWVFVGAAILSLCVFIPGIGFEYNGAHRWLLIGPLSFQPAELLKIAYVLYIAAWLSGVKGHIKTFKFGIIPWLIITGVCGIALLLQPDTDTFLVLALSGLAMLFVAGGAWKHLIFIALIGLIGLTGLVIARPYVLERVMTFVNPAANPLESGYQIQQSLIAIGSGGVTGRGFGQSIQKFNFLPEPMGDSIFAVYAEEFGFIGALVLIGLFLLFAIRGYKLAAQIHDPYGSFLVVGFITVILVQSFMNIAAMLSLIPLSGLPLLFVSHGGTALFFTLASMGVVFNISRHANLRPESK